MAGLKKFNRRSFLARVVGGSFAAGGALVLFGRPARSHPVSDSDPYDQPGEGRQPFPANDTDEGAEGDPAGQGTRLGHFSDGDGGTTADPAGHGRRWSDDDRGPTADRAGRGRRLRRPAAPGSFAAPEKPD